MKNYNNESNPEFDMKKAEAEYASSIRGMRKAAKSYKDYKLKDEERRNGRRHRASRKLGHHRKADA